MPGTSWVLPCLVLAASAPGARAPAAPDARAPAQPGVPPARFEDPERLARIERALPQVDAAFRKIADDRQTPGVVWGVVVDGKLVHAGAAGLRDVAAKAPVERDTAFRIASMTKSFTAAAVLRLRDAGRLSLEDRVDRWVPELRGQPGPTRDAAPLTLRALLTHGGGFPEDNPWGDRQLAISDALFSRWLRGGLLASSSTGTAFEYSNTGFALLGRVVARASGMRYRDYVDQLLLEPLGLKDTHWAVDDVPAARRAHGYRPKDAGWEEEVPLGDGAYGAMGGLVTTVPDLARWVAFQLQAWPPRDEDDRGPLRRSSLREMQQVARVTAPSLRRDATDGRLDLRTGGYGFGLGASRSCALSTVAHSGGLPGWGSFMGWLPESGIGILAFTNVTYGGPGLGPAVQGAFKALVAAGATSTRVVQPSPALLDVQARVDRLLARWDDAEARALAAENFFLDEPLEARRAAFAGLTRVHGACKPEGALRAENALRGRWTLACERGRVRLFATIAPVPPARVQQLDVASALPLEGALARAASSVGALTSGWSDAAAEQLLDPAVDRAAVRQRLAEVSVLHGACTPGEVRSGDGRTSATVAFRCARGDVDVALELEPRSGKLRAPTVAKPEGQVCPD